ncbi:MAG: PKD domain-containing protein, partial [Flavobacteriaceae bacterium]|nr:PKD domain-containing protein [Flavobacteriaceae bacterium]
LIGGRESSSVEMYDYQNDTWVNLGNAPINLNHFQGVEYQGLIWVIGALVGDNFPIDNPAENIWIYSPVNNEWIQGPEIPVARRRGAAGLALYNEKFYLLGGNTNGHDGGYVSWFDEYDPATGTWTTLPDAPTARDHFYASVIGDKMYAAAGRLSGGPGGVFQPNVPEVDVYDFTNGRWSTLPIGSNIPTPRAGPVTVVYNGKLMLMGGSVQNQEVYGTLTTDVLTLTEEFDPVSETWSRIEDANFKRRATQGIVSGNGVFTTGGSDLVGGGTIKNMEFYGQDNPTGTPLIISELSGPGTTQVPLGQNSDITLDVSGGNTGIIVTSMSLSGPDAAQFSINAGELTNGLIKANTSHIVTIGYNGSATGELATLTVNYGISDQITIELQSGNSGAVSSFTLINADTDTDVLTLTPGLQIDESTLSGTNMTVRANTNPTVVGSVFLQISGPVNASRTENVVVYALFGNSGSDYFGQPFPLGSYTMTATAYSGFGLSGTDLGTLTIQFDIVNGGGGNVPPAVSNPGTQTNTEGDNISLQIVATDESTNLNYSATGLPPNLSINNSTGLISGTVSTGSNSGFFQEQNGLVIVDAESGSVVPTWSETTTGGATGIKAGTDHFFDQNGGTIPYEVTISTPGVYRFNWRSFYSGSDPTEENDNWLRFPNNNDVWFFGFQGTVTDEAGVITNLQGAQSQIVFPIGSSRVTAGTTPNGSGGNGYFKIFRSGGAPEVYSWQAATSDNDGHKIYVWFVNPGTYTFEISERSLGHAIDRVSLYKIDTYGDTYDTNNLTNAPESPSGEGAAAGSPYPVEVTVTDDGSPALSTAVQFTWNIGQGNQNQPPTAVASANLLNGDIPLQVEFTGSGSIDDVGIVSYFWDFKDGNTSSQADPVYTFNTPGTYNVELSVQDGAGLNDTDSVTITVTDPVVNQPPTAVASASPLSGNIPLQVSFTGSNSTDDSGISIYSWDFGDGGSSNLADPIYTYNGAGNFTATLTVTDGDNLQDNTTIIINANDPGQNGVVNFTLINADTDQDLYNLSDGQQIIESTISGTNLAIRANTNPSVVGSVFLQISGAINSSRTENAAAYALFGNSGSNYFGQLFPVGSYTMTATAYSEPGLSGNNLGSFTIQFDVVNGGGGNAPPTALASADIVTGIVPLQVNFTGSNSTDDVGVTGYLWDFQDGSPVTSMANPTHTFDTAGIYAVELTVNDIEGLTDQAVINITVNDPAPSTVESFTLVNADTDQDLYNLSDGQQIIESTISGTNLAIRANTNPSVVGSVF